MAILLLVTNQSLYAQNILKGRYLDAETREAVAGASVFLQAAGTGTTTNATGDFHMVVNFPDTLIVTHINYATRKIPLDPLHLTPLIINAIARNAQQEEVVVIGYGTTTKRLSTGSISKIGAAVIAQQPVTNVLAALQGRAPGIFVTTENGLPGGNINIQVRGQNSLASGNAPLYIVDGVPFNSTPLNQGYGDLMYANGPLSPLNSLNPADIENIEILKDADATAIYGSRGANGVILITTKKGKAGSGGYINMYRGVSAVGHFSKLLSLQQYLMLRREAFRNDSIEPEAWDAPDLVVWDTTRSTNWQEYILGGRAIATDVQAGFTGGNEQTRFLLSGSYHHETSILPGSQYYQRAGAYLSLDHHNNNKRLNLTFTTGFTKDKNVLPPDIYSYALLPPNFNSYNTDSSLNWSLGLKNPAALLMQRTLSETENLISNLALGYRLWNDLVLKISAGYAYTRLNQFASKPAKSLNPLFGEPNSAVYSETAISSYIAEPQLSYSKTFSRHTISILAGGTWQKTVLTGTTTKGIKYSNEAMFGSLAAAGDIGYISNRFTDYRYVSAFARLNYNYNDKYISDVSFRRDGSSRFGPGRRYGNFAATGIAWLFTQEKYFHRHATWLSSGKWRASYGTAGNDQVQDYGYLSTYAPGTNYNGVTSLYPLRIANPDYGWERTGKLELAIELGLFKNRLTATIAWYNNRSGNQLVQYPLPAQTGFTGYQYNLPAIVQNTGWEIEWHTLNIKQAAFSWETNFNISLPRNRLVSFPGLASSSYANTYVVGKSINIIKGYHFLGIDPQTGIPQYEDVNKDGQLTEPDDFVVIGDQSPQYYGGLGNDISYKGFSLTFFLQFVQQKGIMPPSLPGFLYSINSYATVLGRWQHPGDHTTVPVATANYSSAAWQPVSELSSSSAVVGNAGYLRLKTVSLSYNLPHKWLAVLAVQSGHVYLQAQNLFTVTKPGRLDPELLSFAGGIPPLRTIATGLQINF